MIRKILFKRMKMGRTGLCALAVILLLGPFCRGFADGAQVPDEKGVAEATPSNYSLFFAPPRASSFSDVLTISPVNVKGSTGGGVADPSPNRAAGLDLLNQTCPTKPRSYLFSFENPGQDTPYVGLAQIDHSDTGQKGRTFYDQYNTELMVGCNIPGGSVLFGKGVQVERPGDTSFRLMDDGWRLKFIKKF